jgi:hypothetical protein
MLAFVQRRHWLRGSHALAALTNIETSSTGRAMMIRSARRSPDSPAGSRPDR